MMKTRLAIKNGVVDWTASTNATDFELVGPAPFEGRLLSVAALRRVAYMHDRLKRADGDPARAPSLKGAAVLTGSGVPMAIQHIARLVRAWVANPAVVLGREDVLRLVEAKIRDPKARDLWLSLLGTAA